MFHFLIGLLSFRLDVFVFVLCFSYTEVKMIRLYCFKKKKIRLHTFNTTCKWSTCFSSVIFTFKQIVAQRSFMIILIHFKAPILDG